MPVIGMRDGHVALLPMNWGWRPKWATSPLINAQGESLEDKSTFKKPFQSGHRCLVPADGFYEWQKLPGGGKQPMRFVIGQGEQFFFAGLHQQYPIDDGQPEDCFLLLTTAANDVVAPIHNRMPVILRERTQLEAWLGPDLEAAKALTRHQEEGLRAYPVSKLVNNARNDSPACAEPLEGGLV